MTHPQQTTREVIEQLVEALDHCMGAITERGLNGSPDQAEKWGLQLPLERAYAALAAGQQALEQTQVEAEPEWNDENVIAYCIARGISAAKAFTTGATHPQAAEPAPSTAGELASKTAMLAKTTAWLDGMGGAIHTYSSRGIALAGFERGWEAALLQSTADHIAEQRKLVAAMPVVQLTHPTAEMQIAGGAVELDYTGVQTAPKTVGWLTAARVWLAMERARRGDGNEHASIANPYQPGTAHHKAWSEGYNGERLFTHPMSAYGRAHSQGRIIGGHQP